MKEQWVSIENYEGLYEISNYGNVRSLPRKSQNRNKLIKFLNLTPTGRYTILSFYKKGVRKSMTVHRLVAKAFIPNPDNKPMVNHRDGNGHNNRIDNLEWCTHSENVLHSFRTLGAIPWNKGNSKTKIIDCEYCGKQRTVKNCEKIRFCNNHCSAQWRRIKKQGWAYNAISKALQREEYQRRHFGR